MTKIRLIELFAGIGACSTALKRLGFDVEIVDAVEIDKYAIKSFNAVHGTNFVPQDITEWDKDISNIDLIMHGSPCQDFSLAGLQRGGDFGSGTRSSLMYETLRIVKKVKPKYVVWENVKNLLSKKHFHNFEAYLKSMEELGYTSSYKVLNSKEYGIPQNRERIFTISIRNDIEQEFNFPDTIPLKLRLKDMLEQDVDDKYYLSDAQFKRIKTTTYCSGQRRIQEKDWSDTLCARDWKDPKCVAIKNANKKGYENAYEGDSVNLQYPDSTTRRGRVGHDVAQTLQTDDSMGVVELKRGYSVLVNSEKEDTTEIDVIGNYSKSGYNATEIVGKNGIAPTVRENHGQVTGITEEIKCIQVAQLYGTDKEPNPSGGRVYDENGLMRTLGVGSGMSKPYVATRENKGESADEIGKWPKE